MTKRNLWKSKEKAAAAGMCIALLGAASVLGTGQTEAQAKTVYWEIGTETASAEEEDFSVQPQAVEYAQDSQERSTAQEGISDEAYAVHLQEEFQYLEKFGVTYEENAEAFFYKDKKVRWLIDESAEKDAQRCCYNEDGKIDVYTVRDEEGKLEGVRVADEKEYNEGTDRMETAVLVEDEVQQESAVAENDLFRALGLIPAKKGHWTYQGKTVAGIYVQDIGFTTWGDVAEGDGICLYVAKEEKEGELTWKIREVSGRELIQIYQS